MHISISMRIASWKNASPMRACPTHAPTSDICARASAVPPRRIEDRPSASAAVARRRPKSGAYPGQRGDARGVPRADVSVERRRNVERLRAESQAVVHASGKGSHV